MTCIGLKRRELSHAYNVLFAFDQRESAIEAVVFAEWANKAADLEVAVLNLRSTPCSGCDICEKPEPETA